MKREDLFEKLTPPPGGLEALRAERDRRDEMSAPRKIRARIVPAAAVLAVAAAILLYVLTRPASEKVPDVASFARSHADTSEVALGLAPVPADVSLPEDERATTVLVRVPTTRSDVTFYWIDSTKFTP